MRTALLMAGLFALALAMIAVAPPGARWSATSGADNGPALEEIQGQRIAAHVQFLADDLLEGRATSTRGGQLAARYLAAQLAQLGYEPAGDGGTYFQDVPIVESVVSPSFRLAAGSGTPYRYLDDVVAFSDVQEREVVTSGEVVFVGHGIVAPESDWNDYSDIDMTGRVALVMVNEPPATADEPGLFRGPALTYYGRWTYKFEEAARQGAAGALLIHTDESATYPWQVVQSSWSGAQYSIPASAGVPRLALKAWVSDRAARDLVMRAGRDLDALRAVASRRGARPVPLGITASASITQTVQRKTAPNVIGVLRGTNPDQGVLYTAHYDHLGVRDPQPGDPPDADRIYNGAVDNASGLAGTLAIAQAFARAHTRPMRSMYVLFTTAEESGLLGAEYFAAHPALPPEAWAANINVDSLNMAGPTRDIVLLGSERSTIGEVASRLVAERERVVGPDPEPGRGYFFRSDHFPLAKIGIPAVSLGTPVEFTGAKAASAKKARDEYESSRYHQPSDEVHAGWDYTAAVEDLRLLARIGWQIANTPGMPAYHATEAFARPRASRAP